MKIFNNIFMMLSLVFFHVSISEAYEDCRGAFLGSENEQTNICIYLFAGWYGYSHGTAQG